MIAFGVGEVAGCFFIGAVIDKIGSKKAAYVNTVTCACNTAIVLAFLITN